MLAEDLMSVRTRFVTTPDGIRLAWTELGSGPPLVLSRGWITHVELSWEDQAFRRFIEVLAQSMRIIRFDHRGMGLSDRDVPLPSIEDLVTDLVAVIDVAVEGEATVWGSLFGGPTALRYAATHPDRISRLILDTTWARPADLMVETNIAKGRQYYELIRALPEPEPAMAFGSYLADPAPEMRHEERVERARRSIDPEMLRDLYFSIGTFDVEQDAAAVRAPTLVLHKTESFVPLAAGQRLATTVPGAEFVTVRGQSSNLWEGDTAPTLNAIAQFLDFGPVAALASDRAAVVVLLMTDLVESTSVTSRLGDDAAQPLQAFHDLTVRTALAEHGGVECDHTGDGILARFNSAAEAVRCAERIQARFGARNIHEDVELCVRIGLNAGEPIQSEGDKVFGSAVQKTARVCAAAGPTEVLVAPVVRALVEGKSFRFEDRGEHQLKGFSETIHLYALRSDAGEDRDDADASDR
jgi:class 3 adenylate cyclase